MAKSYSSKDITVLEGLEGVRKKPSMYIGDTDSRGILHLFKEVKGNAVDEASNGHGDLLAFSIDENVFTVFDTGRGIPFGPHPKNKKMDTMTLLATQLHSGGKLDADSGNYDISLGTHGVGLAVVNALSIKLQIWSIRDGVVMTQSFSKGKPTTEVIKAKATPKFNGKSWPPKGYKTGTIVQWTPDFSVFDPKSKVEPLEVVNWLKDVSWFITSKVKKATKTIHKPITFQYTVNGKFGDIRREDLREYPSYQLIKLHKKDKSIELMNDTINSIRTDRCDFVGAWSTFSEIAFSSACNGAVTMFGGTHEKGALKGIEDAFRGFSKKAKFKQADLMTGYVGCVNIKIPSPRFDSQSKTRLTSPEAEKITYTEVFNIVSAWIKKNKDAARQIIERAVQLSAISEDSRTAKKLAAALKTKKGGKTLLPPELVTSKAKRPEDRELTIVEGESAAGSAVFASNREFQEVLPLRGKILNVEKADTKKIANSNAIVTLLQSIGYDPKNPTKPLRVGRIHVMSDPDPDGPLAFDTVVVTQDEDVQIKELADRYDLNQSPVTVFSKGSTTISPSEAIDVSVKELSKVSYTITFSDGGFIRCTGSHKWPIKSSISSDRVPNITYDLFGVAYLPTTVLAKNDVIYTDDELKPLTVVSVLAKTITTDEEFYCMTVPYYSNFMIKTSEGSKIMTSNCHINALSLAVLWNTVPYMFKEGRIFLVKAPLYLYNLPNGKLYGNSMSDLASKIKGTLDPSKVTRAKGYGELNPEDLNKIAFDPTTRSLLKVKHPGAQASQIAQALGKDVTFRQTLLGV